MVPEAPPVPTDCHLLVIGAGDPRRGDEGVGEWVVQQLRAPLAARGTALHLEVVPLELFLLWSEESLVLIVDAVLSGAEPGTVHRFDARQGPLPVRVFRSSRQGLGVAQAVGLARALGRLPARLEVWGVEGRCFEAQPGLSSPVARAAEELVGLALAWIDRAAPRAE